ncbi:GDSL-type esterase/lipase family protein [Asticcacaulis sp. SL142]|uniref:GDSL-type esterase/lipase family protein n=1 Tax=Asticcacaulis sp. SL142 TaxID=2995155 RepID=UPI00226CA87E|nr:GDSL-type esterase/lipase family protein [Asticcacaulis sp. SL142]WAC46842.1 GDSL-type esterase/lipase family protein [Asticcacaulis sp. SL142]
MQRRWVLKGLATAGMLTAATRVQADDLYGWGRLSEDWWAARHKAILDLVATKPDPEVILIGDSLTQNYEKAILPDENFQPTWQRFYGPRRALNLGYSGDTTSNVLWRIQNGEIEGLNPKVAILLVGTNDTDYAGRDAQQTVRGIDAVVAELERRLPQSHILLLGLLPSQVSETKTATDRAVNAHLASNYELNPRVTYLDIGSVFMRPDGSLNTAIFYDPRLKPPRRPLHPDTKGQGLMAQAIEPTLARLLGRAPVMPLEAMTQVNTALIPVPRLEIDSYDWYARHQAVKAAGRKMSPKVVMMGDSITHFWGGTPVAQRASGQEAWDSLFGQTSVLNLGFGWDRTQNVLWRLRQGEFDGLTPDWVVLNIGTNNLTGSANARASTPAEVAEGVGAIVADIRTRSPKTRIIVMGIFPRGFSADDSLRPLIRDSNRLIKARLNGLSHVTLLDIGGQYLHEDGQLRRDLMPDSVHPNNAGYEVWARALSGVLS